MPSVLFSFLFIGFIKTGKTTEPQKKKRIIQVFLLFQVQQCRLKQNTVFVEITLVKVLMEHSVGMSEIFGVRGFSKNFLPPVIGDKKLSLS